MLSRIAVSKYYVDSHQLKKDILIVAGRPGSKRLTLKESTSLLRDFMLPPTSTWTGKQGKGTSSTTLHMVLVVLR